MNGKEIKKTEDRRMAVIFMSFENGSKDEGKGKLKFHLEKRMPDEDFTEIHWAGVHLPTIGGKVTKMEDERKVIDREVEKRFGRILGSIVAKILDNGGIENKILFRDEDITVYGLIVPDQLIDIIYLPHFKKRLVGITVDQMSNLVQVSADGKFKRNDSHGTIPVFPKHFQALVAAVKKFYP